MTTKSTIITRTALLCGTAGAAAAAILLAGAMLTATPRTAEAFPAYAQKTGFVCGVCHNNAKGGGPLSPYGIKWVTGGMKAHPAPPPKPKK
jgi:mono/diheme cytochrome c family protein